MELPEQILSNPSGDAGYWDTAAVHALLAESGSTQAQRSTERALEKSGLFPAVLKADSLHDELGRAPIPQVFDNFEAQAKRKRLHSLYVQLVPKEQGPAMLFANDGRGARRWVYLESDGPVAAQLEAALVRLAAGKPLLVWPHGDVTAACRELMRERKSHQFTAGGVALTLGSFIYQEAAVSRAPAGPRMASASASGGGMTHLDHLEAESMHIMREVAAQAENPVMLYSVGKDSSVMLHLAKKAFHPSPPPFPLMHVDTRWKFQAMYRFRDEMAREVGMKLIVHINPEGVEKNINPFDHGSSLHTDVMKTQGLKQALDEHGFDVAFGGARRDEEKSRAKERVFSFRTKTHRWDPKNQRPELWNLYNASKNPGESVRVFPLSNWTELDIWQYLYREKIPLVPLYFAQERPVVERDGLLMLVDDDRLQLFPDEQVQLRQVRFRTLGCYPLTGAFDSDADELSSLVLELLQSKTSERQGRAIDTDSAASMEKKKQEGYF